MMFVCWSLYEKPLLSFDTIDRGGRGDQGLQCQHLANCKCDARDSASRLCLFFFSFTLCAVRNCEHLPCVTVGCCLLTHIIDGVCICVCVRVRPVHAESQQRVHIQTSAESFFVDKHLFICC